MNVTLRKRLKGKKISLYLDYYEGGVRKYEYLKLYLHPDDKEIKLTKQQKEENRVNIEIAELIRSKRIIQITNREYSLTDKDADQRSFFQYFESMMENKANVGGSYGNWRSTLIHLRNFEKFDVSFRMVNKTWLERFQSYLKTQSLTINTQISYFNKVVAAINSALNEGVIHVNPVLGVKRLKEQDSEREFLTIEELRNACAIECELPDLKRAFIFSALTGLRWSDIIRLRWRDIQHTVNNGYFIRFKQQKTKAFETLPIGEQAHAVLAEKLEEFTNTNDLIFDGLVYSAWNNKKLKNWLKLAGITKKITFHCARHTYATLQLSHGTDIYTVSKLLGHKNLQTTQIYAKVVDQKKIEAANRIIL